jgi:ATP-dependent Lhr-like helicase
VRAHHGSLRAAAAIEIEDRSRPAMIRGLVATSSLELGIDMGAIDLGHPDRSAAVGRERHAAHRPLRATPSIKAEPRRHRPKYRGDLVACAAVTRAMHEAQIESSRYPRNPLDVLAQQIVAMVAMEPWDVDALFGAVRSAAPFADLSRAIFDGVLDMLSGRYPSDDFADLRPRLTWDRLKNLATAREGAKRVAVINGGTIPDRGPLRRVSRGRTRTAARVGELDEEMVFESRVGETFLLGASSWRIEEITHDRVIVSPAPGQPGKMPFWKADAAGRPLELGRHIGELVRSLRQMPAPAAIARLTKHHDLDRRAAENLVKYLADRRTPPAPSPTTRRSSSSARATSWATGGCASCRRSAAASTRHGRWPSSNASRTSSGSTRRRCGPTTGSWCGFRRRNHRRTRRCCCRRRRRRRRSSCASWAAPRSSRRSSGKPPRARCLLPRRRPGGRTPLWQQRKRAADLLAVAGDVRIRFPMVLGGLPGSRCATSFDIPAASVETLPEDRGARHPHGDGDATTPSTVRVRAARFGYVGHS